MATTTYSKGIVVASTWLNDVNALTYTIFNGITVVPSSGKTLRSNGTNIVPSTFTIPDTYTTGDILYASATNTLTALAKTNSSILTTSAGGVPQWTPAGLTVAYGGIGATTLGTSNNLVLSNGTSALTAVASTGTTTTVLHGNASGAPTFASVTASDFGTQTANTVLAGPTSGAAATPTFRALVGADGASWVLISSQTANNSTSLDFTTGIDSTYDAYCITLTGVLPATDDAALWLRISQDGGSTYKAGASDYTNQGNLTQAGTNNGINATATNIALSTNASNAVGDGGISGTVWFFNPASSTKKKWFMVFTGHARTATGAELNVYGNRYTLDNNAINAIRFMCSSGNITSGTISLYGVKKV